MRFGFSPSQAKVSLGLVAALLGLGGLFCGSASAGSAAAEGDVLNFTATSTTYGGTPGAVTVSTSNPGGSCISERYGSCSITAGWISDGLWIHWEGLVWDWSMMSGYNTDVGKITYGPISAPGMEFGLEEATNCGTSAPYTFCGELFAEQGYGTPEDHVNGYGIV